MSALNSPSLSMSRKLRLSEGVWLVNFESNLNLIGSKVFGLIITAEWRALLFRLSSYPRDRGGPRLPSPALTGFLPWLQDSPELLDVSPNAASFCSPTSTLTSSLPGLWGPVAVTGRWGAVIQMKSLQTLEAHIFRLQSKLYLTWGKLTSSSWFPAFQSIQWEGMYRWTWSGGWLKEWMDQWIQNNNE